MVGANYLDLKSVKFQIDAKARDKDSDVWGYNSNGKLKGYYWIHLGIDGASEYLYRQLGDKVLVKRLDVERAVDAASAKMIAETLSLNSLLQKYYSTSAQKETVNQLAKKLSTNSQSVSTDVTNDTDSSSDTQDN